MRIISRYSISCIKHTAFRRLKLRKKKPEEPCRLSTPSSHTLNLAVYRKASSGHRTHAAPIPTQHPSACTAVCWHIWHYRCAYVCIVAPALDSASALTGWPPGPFVSSELLSSYYYLDNIMRNQTALPSRHASVIEHESNVHLWYRNPVHAPPFCMYGTFAVPAPLAISTSTSLSLLQANEFSGNRFLYPLRAAFRQQKACQHRKALAQQDGSCAILPHI